MECYGGMDIIDFGNFHQFPPIGNPSAALYWDRPETDNLHVLKERSIFLEYNQVVILHEQMRITDDFWSGLLSRLRWESVPRKTSKRFKSSCLQITHVIFLIS